MNKKNSKSRRRNHHRHYCYLVVAADVLKSIVVQDERNLEEESLIELQPSPFDSILDAVLTVSPKRQYRGIVIPTTPATTGPKRKKIIKLVISRPRSLALLICCSISKTK